MHLSRFRFRLAKISRFLKDPFNRTVHHLNARQEPPALRIYSLPSRELRRSLSKHFCAHDGVAIGRAVARLIDGARVRVEFDPAAVQHKMSCVWSRSQKHGSSFIFSTFQPGQMVDTVVNRWLALSDLYTYLDRPENPDGRVVISFNDIGAEPGLTFCGNRPDSILIPDSDFLKSRGYAKAREYFAKNLLPWDQRRTFVFWRGSSLGAKGKPILEMPRARLCQIAKAARDNWLDIGLVDTADVSESDAAQLRSLNLIKERVHWTQLHKYCFHVDIDGNANSYAGLFRKLLSGGLVLKVASPDHCTQWYYHLLKPWENFVPVRSDLSDLLEVAAYCRDHDDLARSIAFRGRELALSMTYEKELTGAVETVRKAFSKSTTN